MNTGETPKLTIDDTFSRIESFREKIKVNDESGCWEWQASLYDNGYGAFWANDRMVRAHRFSYETFVGAIPENLILCHKCDNRICVNPQHLFPGTYKDNMQDAVKKGRNVLPTGNKIKKGQAALKPNDEVLTKVRDYFKTNPNNSNHQASLDLGIDPLTIRTIRSRKPLSETKLTGDEVSEVRQLLHQKVRVVDIASRFDVTISTIYNIRKGKTYKNL